MNVTSLNPLVALFPADAPDVLGRFAFDSFTTLLPLLQQLSEERPPEFKVLVETLQSSPTPFSRIEHLLQAMVSLYPKPTFERALALTTHARFLRRTNKVEEAMILLQQADTLYDGYNDFKKVRALLEEYQFIDLPIHQAESSRVMGLVRRAADTATEIALCYAMDVLSINRKHEWWTARWKLQIAINLENCVLSYTFATTYERERLRYLQLLDLQESVMLSLVEKGYFEPERAYRVILQRKGIAIELFGFVNDAIFGATPHPELHNAYQAYKDEARQMEQIGMSAIVNTYGRNAKFIGASTVSAERLQILEVELARHIPKTKILDYLDEEHPSDLLNDCDLITPQIALLDYVRYRQADIYAYLNHDTPPPEMPEQYMVFVLRKAKDGGKRDEVWAKTLPLNATQIEQAIKQWRVAVVGETLHTPKANAELLEVLKPSPDTGNTNAGIKNTIDLLTTMRGMRIISNMEDGIQAGQQLRIALLDPLADYIKEIEKLVICPDAELAQIPFQALVDKEGDYLVHRYCISYVSSGRDLLDWKHREANPFAPSSNIIIANPNYDFPENPYPNHPFGNLTHAAEEGKQIKALIPQAILWTDDKATEENLFQADGVVPRLLHFATHGFVAPSMEELRRMLSRHGSKPAVLPTDSPLQDPLLRVGLVLAGANCTLNRKRYQSDNLSTGILTGAAIKNMNLRGTEMVVLSACDTGLGDIVVGEGVFGLRRAFAIAGARTLILSLWKVDDKVTAEMMIDFYKNIIEGKKSRGDALWETQKKFALAYPKKPGMWAAFICEGDPGPLLL